MQGPVIREIAGGVIGILALVGIAVGGYVMAAGWADYWTQYGPRFDRYACDVYPILDPGDAGDTCSLILRARDVGSR
jgi:hypothetical protein